MNAIQAAINAVTVTETREVYGVVRFIAPGKTKASYVKRVDVCSNLPVGTSIGKALVMREGAMSQLVFNMNRRGYVAQFVPTGHTCTMVNGQPAGRF